MFYQYVDCFQTARRVCLKQDVEETRFYQSVKLVAHQQGNSSTLACLDWEQNWRKAGRPYYNVYPGILGMLLKLDIGKVKLGQLKEPSGQNCLLVNLPKGNRLNKEGQDIRHLYLCLDVTGVRLIGGERLMTFGVNYGEQSAGMPVWDVLHLPLEDVTFEDSYQRTREREALQVTQYGLSEAESRALHRVMSLVCTLCLLGDDPEIIQPDLLDRDRRRVTDQNLEQLIQRARQRGKTGWTIGSDMETVPHFRRPHPALYWTGPGRQIASVIWRKGALVHRDKVEKIPTGYMDDETEPAKSDH